MNQGQIECFLAVARCGSVHRAAERLGIAQSSASYRIQALERELGVPLFRREGRALVLNDAGTGFFSDMLRIKGDFEAAVKKVRFPARAPSRISVLWPGTICDRDLVLSAVRAYGKENPEAEVDILAADWVGPSGPVSLRCADAAITLVEDRGPDDGRAYFEACAMRSACQVGLDHPLAHACELGLPDLVGYRIIMVPRGRYLSAYDRMLRRLEEHVPSLDVRFVESQSDIEVNMASGRCLTIRPAPLGRLGVPMGRVVAVPLVPPNTIHLAFACTAGDALAEGFCQFAAKHVREMVG